MNNVVYTFVSYSHLALQKKKKVKPLDEAAWSNADIEFPSTSTSDDIEIIQKHDACHPPIVELSKLALDDVSIGSEQEKNDEANAVPVLVECNTKTVLVSPQPEESTETNLNGRQMEPATEIVTKDENNESIVAIIPSAPHIEDLTITTESSIVKSVEYPKLHEMLRLEPTTLSGLHQSGHQRIILKPFNEMQLKELYHNPELALAERFESDFIRNELNCVYKEHPLYELIKKYSQSRYNLKINMLDLHNYIKGVQVNLEDVWKISTLTITFEGLCRDNERVQKSERYEWVAVMV